MYIYIYIYIHLIYLTHSVQKVSIHSPYKSNPTAPFYISFPKAQFL